MRRRAADAASVTLGFPAERNARRLEHICRETLRLEIESEGCDDVELGVGQVTLDSFDPAGRGRPFAPALGALAVRVPGVAAARAAKGRPPRP